MPNLHHQSWFDRHHLTRWLLLCCLTLGALLPAPPAHAEDSVSPQKLEALKSRIKTVTQWLNHAQIHRNKLLETLRDTERQIGSLNLQLQDLQSKSDSLSAKLKQLSDRENKLRSQLESQKQGLKAQIRAAWMQGDAPALKVLLNQADPQQVARTMTYYSYLSRQDVAQLKQFNDTLSELQSTRQETTQAQLALADTQEKLKAKRDDLGKQQSERQDTLAKLKSEITDKQQELTNLKANQQRLEKLLDKVQSAVANMPLPKDSTPFGKLRAKLPWPTHGRVVGHYGAPVADGKLHRNGILIATSANAPVIAVHYGRVVFANWLRGFGLLIIIDHGHGYMTLYGHNNSLMKRTGDWVSAGETIALAGNSGGADTTGLYFEIRHHGRPVNPLRWLRK